MSSKNKPIQIPFGEWRPDVAHVNTGFLATCDGVFPSATGYVPQKKLVAIGGGGSLTGTALDAYAAPFSSSSNFDVVAGTATKLFAKRAADVGWTEITRSAGAYTSALHWSFTHFGDLVLAANGVDEPQVYTTGSLNDAADLAGSPPKFNYFSVCGSFVFGLGTASAPSLLRWSGIEDQTSWTVGTDLCDEQFFYEGGPLLGAYGDQEGYVLQRGGIRRFRFLPGDTTTVFEFDRLPGIPGPVNQKAWTVFANTLFYRSDNGLVALNQNGIRLIGVDKVDGFAATSGVNTHRVIPDIFTGRIFFPYGTNNAKALVYDTKHDRWTNWVNNTSNDNIHTWVSHFDPTGSTHTYPMAIKSDGALYGANGDKHVTSLITSDFEFLPARRVTVNGARLDTDALQDELSVTARTREVLSSGVTGNAATANTTNGQFDVTTSGRFTSFQVSIEETDDDWSYLNGLTVWPQGDGEY